MRAHQPGSTPIDIPETVPNPAYTPAPTPAPERAPTKVPEKVPEKVIAPDDSGAFFFRSMASNFTHQSPHCAADRRHSRDADARLQTGVCNPSSPEANWTLVQ
jgi:hypothetical protein